MKINEDLEQQIQDSIKMGYVIIPHIRFDFDGMYTFARSRLNLSPKKSLNWVQSQFSLLREYITSLTPDDSIISPMESKDE